MSPVRINKIKELLINNRKMTAEIVVMNREGVALAADSVVTVHGSKMFNTANKLFMLAPNYPVGILIYNNAGFMNLPWEIIIKVYRDYIIENEIKYDTLDEYSESFLKFIVDNNEIFATIEQQIHLINYSITPLLIEINQAIFKEIDEFVSNTARKIPESKVEEFTKRTIDKYYNDLSSIENVIHVDEIEGYKEEFFERYGDTILEIKREYLEALPIDSDDDSKIDDCCFMVFSKETELPFYSGVVFAGYGEKDIFPSCMSCFVEGLICDKLKFRVKDNRRIDFSGASAYIIPFAQRDIVDTFIQGRHPSFIDALIEELHSKVTEQELNEILESVHKKVEIRLTSSIMDAVDALPKEDLALMAETMVSLTSFMRKVSMDLESVGGPIDVAVISKKDGFIWIKRKHYFDMERNPHYMERYI